MTDKRKVEIDLDAYKNSHVEVIIEIKDGYVESMQTKTKSSSSDYAYCAPNGARYESTR